MVFVSQLILTFSRNRAIMLTALLVPRPGLEPGWVAPLVFETSASTDSAIWAFAGAKIHKKYK